MWSTPPSAAAGSTTGVPVGDVVASVPTYDEARAVVDRLVRAEVPAGAVSIVGSDLRSVERVTGRMNAGRAALSGLLSGLVLGAFVGLFVLIVNPETNIGTLGSVTLMAVGFSILWNVLGFALNRRRKEFTSVMQVVAGRFDIVVPHEVVPAAEAALAGSGFRPDASVHAPVPQVPVTSVPSAAADGTAPATGPAAPGGASPDTAPAAPAVKPRTYGEAQDEARRRSNED